MTAPRKGDETVTVDGKSSPDADGPATSESAFEPGDIVAGRYHILRFIAFGGMGEVYEVDDQVLHELVALKTVRADVSDDEVAIERFKREILLARKVTHKNVCRIFDLGLHTPTGRDPQMFLTMELLHGATLADRVRGSRPLTTDEARPVLEQMAAGLDAAHREGIVHRDFKSGNVMLCKAATGQMEPRVVITDFGLARGADTDPFSTNATGTVAMMGSPAYMAPEQVEGGIITRAADIYALGVVMFEMLTGRVPFTGDSAMSCAVKRLKEPAPSPRVHLPDLDEVWEKAILRCLEREPAARFASAGDVARAVLGTSSSSSEIGATQVAPGRRPVAPRRLPRAAPWVAGGVLVAALAFAGWQLAHRARPAATVVATNPQTGPRRAIAVLGFKNLAHREDIAWLSTALSEMLTTEMGAGGALRTIPGESIARMKKELALEDAESYAADTLGRIQRNLNADYVVLGSYVPLGDRIRLDVRLQNTATGETLLQVADTGSEAELAAMVQRTGTQLRAQLRMGDMNEADEALVSASLPRSPEAARLYAQGLAQLRIFSGGRARELLERAVSLEPAFPQGHAALSEALAYLGYEERSREEAKRAVDLSAGLPEEQRLRVEGMYHSIAGDAARAAEAYRRLWEMAPDNLEWGMRLASAQFGMGEDGEANKTVQRLRAMPNFEDDPRVFVVLMQAALMKQSFQEVRDTAARLAASGEARGALSMVSEAKHSDAIALWFQGDLDEALERSEEARQLAFRLGDRDGVAAAATTRGFVLTEQGQFAAARDVARAALDAAAEVGARRRIWLAEHVLARVGLFGGDLAAARRHYEASRDAAIEVGSKYGEALANLGLAVTLAAQGELDKAEPIYSRMNLGFRLFAPQFNLSFLRFFRGNLELAQGDLAAARQNQEEALELSRKFGERVQGERARVSLALIALREGKLDEAAASALQAADAFVELKCPDDVAQARATLARVRAAQGRAAEAEAAMVEAERVLPATQNVFVRYGIALARAEVSTAAGGVGVARALAVVEPALNEADEKGYVSAAIELRLARAEALIKAHRTVEANQEIARVGGQASRLGFADVLRRAKALQSGEAVRPAGQPVR